MAGILITLQGGGDCVARHGDTGVVLHTSKSPAFGGSGASFSSTDLLGVALGSCIATDLEPVAERHGVPLDEITIEVEKRFAEAPKRIESITVSVRLPEGVDDLLVLKLRRAAGHCLVQRSLSTDIRCSVDFFRGGRLVDPN